MSHPILIGNAKFYHFEEFMKKVQDKFIEKLYKENQYRYNGLEEEQIDRLIKVYHIFRLENSIKIKESQEIILEVSLDERRLTKHIKFSAKTKPSKGQEGIILKQKSLVKIIKDIM